MPVPDFKRDGLWVQSFRLQGVKTNTYSGSVWQGVDLRCREGSITQRDSPCYVGVVNKFKDFQTFTNWHIQQIGYGRGFHIDKDILVPGCNCYSEDTCLLVPREINNLVKTHVKLSGLPVGVFTNGSNYRACIQRNGEQKNLGTFKTVEEAQNIYLKAKIEHIKSLALKWKSEIDPRLYEALMEPEKLIYEKGHKQNGY